MSVFTYPARFTPGSDGRILVEFVELARRLGVHERVIRRMLNPEHASKAEKIQAALAALSKQMTVEVRDAA